MSDEIKQNLANAAHWRKALLIVVYAVIFWLGLWVLGLVVVINLVIFLFSAQRNDQLSDFGRQLVDYLHQVGLYATLNDVSRPFPFAETGAPTATAAAESEPDEAAPAAAKATAKGSKTGARKKTTRKKKTQKKVSPSAADAEAKE